MKSIEFEPHWRRQYSLFQGLGIARQLAVFLRDVGGIVSVIRVEGSEGWITIFSKRGSISQVTEKIRQWMEQHPEEIEEEVQSLRTTGTKWVKFTRQLRLSDKSSTSDLLSFHQRFFDLWAGHIVDLWKSYYFVEAAEAIFEKILREHVSDNRLLQAVCRYSRPSEKAHVMRIADYFNRETDADTRASYLKNNFPWLFSTDPYSPLPTQQQFVDYVGSFAIAARDEGQAEDMALPASVMPFVHLYQDMLYLKDKRDEYRRQAFYYISPLVDEICKRFTITRDHLWYVAPAELVRLESDKSSFLQEIKERKKAYLLHVDAGNEAITFGDEAKRQFVKKEDVSQLKTFLGKSGSTGTVRGKVQVIRSVSDIKNFEPGRVLVATTTNPDYVPAMQKAIAFVTNEGGITCHAAIVARELKKPCVVGTKIATQVLNDGDLVEVDAIRGVVRVIRRAI